MDESKLWFFKWEILSPHYDKLPTDCFYACFEWARSHELIGAGKCCQTKESQIRNRHLPEQTGDWETEFEIYAFHGERMIALVEAQELFDFVQQFCFGHGLNCNGSFRPATPDEVAAAEKGDAESDQ